MEPRQLLDFLGIAARLKDVPRHCKTPGGIPENVAGHSWRIALMALLLKNEFPEIDMDRVIRICLVHDLGEAVTGDIPAFVKTDANEAVEAEAIRGLLTILPPTECGELGRLFAEMEEQRTPEARFFKALDKLEAVIAHNESDISTWIPLERELNLTYATDEAAEFPFLARLRNVMLHDTMKKIADDEREEMK